MRLTLAAVGKVRSGYLREGCEDYLGRIGHYAKVEVAEVKEEPARQGRPAAEIKLREGERLAARLPAGAYRVALCERGDRASTAELAAWMGQLRDRGQRDLAFVIGGPLGLDGELTQRCERRLCLAPFTLPHELARLVLLEQIYRVFTVLAGEPYHNP